jgi:hypothetical protein
MPALELSLPVFLRSERSSEKIARTVRAKFWGLPRKRPKNSAHHARKGFPNPCQDDADEIRKRRILDEKYRSWPLSV